MIRLRLFGRCRIYHDPVSPVLRAPAQIGWEAWFRSIDLVTPQHLKGEELLLRTRGWWTVEPKEVAEVVKKHGRLIVGEEGELMVEFIDQKAVEALSTALIRPIWRPGSTFSLIGGSVLNEKKTFSNSSKATLSKGRRFFIH